MDDQKLLAFLNGKVSGREFQVHVNAEVAAWIKKLRERGRSAPVYLNGDGHLVDMAPRHVARMLDSLMSNDMKPSAFLYVLDVLLMSPRKYPNFCV